MSGATFSPDGRWLAPTCWDGTIYLWEVTTGKRLLRWLGHLGGPDSVVFTPRFTPDGKTLITSGNDQTVRIWDLSRDEPQPQILTPSEPEFPEATRNGFPKRVLRGHTGSVESVQISPDGKTIVSGSKDGTIKLWDLATGKERRTLRGHKRDVSVAFHPGGKLLASGDYNGIVRLWDLGAGTEIQRLSKYGGYWVFRVFFNRDGSRLYAADMNSHVRIWDVNSGELLQTINTDPAGNGGPLYAVALNPDGKTLASWNQFAVVKIWNVASGEIDHTWPGIGKVFTFSPDGKSLVVPDPAERELQLLDVETRQRVREFIGHSVSVSGATFSPDGRWLASTCADGTICLWEVATGKQLLKWLGHPGGADSVVFPPRFTPDGKTLVTCGTDQTVRIWDLSRDE